MKAANRYIIKKHFFVQMVKFCWRWPFHNLINSDPTPNFYGSATLIRYQLLLINVNYYDMYDKYITVLSMYNGYHLENRYDINDQTE
jgi:hypothetical protein